MELAERGERITKLEAERLIAAAAILSSRSRRFQVNSPGHRLVGGH